VESVAALKEWMNTHPTKRAGEPLWPGPRSAVVSISSLAYRFTNGSNDVPVFERVGHAIAVNPMSERVRAARGRAARSMRFTRLARSSKRAVIDSRPRTLMRRGRRGDVMREMEPSSARVVAPLSTGSATLDDALGGGLPTPALILVEGTSGTGSTEFALTVLFQVASSRSRIARFASALRSPGAVGREAVKLMEDPHGGERLDLRHISHLELPLLLHMVEDLAAGDCLVIESTAALARLGSPTDFTRHVCALGEAAGRVGTTILLLHAHNSIDADTEAQIREIADAVFSFYWQEDGPTRRQLLAIPKLRGLAPVLEHAQNPVFDVGMRRGRGAVVSRLESVM